MNLFVHHVNNDLQLREVVPALAEELYQLIDFNRSHLRAWHGWLDAARSAAYVENMIVGWLQQSLQNRGIHAGIWHKGTLCGIIGHLNIDWDNRGTWLSYWIDKNHQGMGIATESVRALVRHAFEILNLHRVTIESAVENIRSRAVAERAGFSLEGTFRGSEWLYDHYVDHVFYGLLSEDWNVANGGNNQEKHETLAAQRDMKRSRAVSERVHSNIVQ
jgi:ribosomal-protein-serine acetyltransferase